MNYKELHERLVSSLSLPPPSEERIDQGRGEKQQAACPLLAPETARMGRGRKREEDKNGRPRSLARPPRSRSPLLFSSVSSHSLLPRALRGKVFRQPLSHLRVIQHSITYAPFCFLFFTLKPERQGAMFMSRPVSFALPRGPPAPQAGSLRWTTSAASPALPPVPPRLFPPARARPPASVAPSLPPSGLQTRWARTLTVGGRLLELTQ